MIVIEATQPSRRIVTIAAKCAYQTFISICFPLKHKQSLQWWNRQFMYVTVTEGCVHQAVNLMFQGHRRSNGNKASNLEGEAYISSPSKSLPESMIPNIIFIGSIPPQLITDLYSPHNITQITRAETSKNTPRPTQIFWPRPMTLQFPLSRVAPPGRLGPCCSVTSPPIGPSP